MGLLRSSPEDRAAGLKKWEQQQAAEGEARRANVESVAGEREARWAGVTPAGVAVPFLERLDLGLDNGTDDAYTMLVEYCAAVGLQPEDTYGFHFEQADNRDANTLRAVAVLYRDRPEYAAARTAYWESHQRQIPRDAVPGTLTDR